MGNSVLIYIVERDEAYGKLIQSILAKHQYKHVTLFTDENECLAHIVNKPKILITSYHLKTMTGLQLIKKARSRYPHLYSILVSADFHNDTNKVFDERFLQYVDKYIIKGMDDMEELIEAVVYNFA